MFTIEEEPSQLKRWPVQFASGFINGLTNHPELGFWLTPLMLLGNEASLVRGVWIAHTLPMTTFGAIEGMILMAVPYVMVLGLLKTLKNMSTQMQIGTDVHLKLRGSVLSILWVSYLCLLCVGP